VIDTNHQSCKNAIAEAANINAERSDDKAAQSKDNQASDCALVSPR
jgi:hypothetical protein